MNNIRDYRKRKGLTLKQLGKIIGVAESTLSKYENGVNEPDLGTLALIADTRSTSPMFATSFRRIRPIT